MRIQGPNSTALAKVAAPASRRAAAGGFSVTGQDAANAPSPSINLRTVGSIDALVALQGLDDPTERRKRAIARGRTALDVLDDLKLGFISGTIDQSTLLRLRAATADLREETGDNALDQVLAEIELRLEVEIAKITPR
ncbi:MAG: flagellar assembly protein FliX [Rhizobiales bacterium]|nr:flagellar assembly protein FliX [Hyphomicrobiales bacterium]